MKSSSRKYRHRPIRGRLRCAKCGSSDRVEFHHVGGRRHLAWAMLPLCRRHHFEVTLALRRAGVNMEFTTDSNERLRRVRQAIYLLLWLLDSP